jgi:DNA-binding response OmpR family regulator
MVSLSSFHILRNMDTWKVHSQETIMAARILVIDDELPLLESMTDILELSGYETLTANSGRAGIDCIKSDRPQLVLCDLMMPGTDGFEVLNETQADANTAHIPVVVVSAKSDSETMHRVLDSGAAGFLSKPFALNELLTLIERHLPVEPA